MNDNIQDLSNSFSMAFSEEYSWSLANVLGLFYEPETYFCSLAGPQGILQNSDNYLECGSSKVDRRTVWKEGNIP